MIANLRPKIHRKLQQRYKKILASFNFFNLGKLAKLYRTDKGGSHSYTQHYQLHFSKFKFKNVNLLEIGVGGYDNPLVGGNSLRMWKKYFPFGNIYSIDIYDKSKLQEKRIKIFQGSQDDESFLRTVVDEIGEIDIIIDDGSHLNRHVIPTFEMLFPHLNEGGIYVIEDTQTSYWPSYGGDSENLNNPNTIVGFFKSLVDSMNNKEFLTPGYQQSYYDKKIISMHFYHNLIFIYKGDNSEESNKIINNSEFK